MKNLILIVLMLTCETILGQKSPMNDYKYINQNYKDTINGFGDFRFGINEQTKDTIKYFPRTAKFQIVTSDGVLITDGNSTSSGHGLKANGFWMERYRTGNLKEHGNYSRNEKIGTWIYFHEIGNIKKIETLRRPYSLELSKHRLPINFQFGKTILRNNILKSGSYKEFFQNGNIKMEGQYSIFEKYETRDTVITFDPETYEEQLHITVVNFWKPISLKTGIWNYYDESGKLTSSETINYYKTRGNENFNISIKRIENYYDENGKLINTETISQTKENEKIRSITTRYKELLESGN